MYTITCDGYNLLDVYDDNCFLYEPVLSLENNTVGGFSFTIYKDHPNFDKLKRIRSVFEVKNGNDCIFRGRMTGDTLNFDHGMSVDIEGAMAYFNDSVVPPFVFPEEWLDEESSYDEVENGRNVVEYFLEWLIDNHNMYVQPFQKFKLGRVTVTDPNNYLYRSSESFATTWETLKNKLFDSSLGGYLCIRYEEDGNYIDYLSEFDEDNSQKITLDDNLLSLKNETIGTDFYTAILPVGADGLTFTNLQNKDMTDDIVKFDWYLYSKSNVEEFGWICAPIDETTWDAITDAKSLLNTSKQWFEDKLSATIPSSLEITAMDLHFTDEDIASLRMYRNVNVVSEEHGVSDKYPITRMDIHLMKPQNTKIYAGKTQMTLIDRTSQENSTVINNVTNVQNTVQNVYDSLAVKVVKSPETSISPGVYYVFGEVDSLDITLIEKESELVQEYCFEFIPKVEFTDFTNQLKITPSVNWYPDLSDVVVESGKTYQVSILHGIGVIVGA